MSDNLNIYFKSDSNNEYIFDSDTSIIFEKNHYEKRIEKITRIKRVYHNKKYDSKDYKIQDIEKYIMRFGLREMILEVTNSCNFRCKYCIFSKYYPNHSKLQNKNMPFETAQKAIDIYISLLEKGKLYNPERSPVIGFYGGEPLLNFECIKKCVDYIKQRYHGSIIFTITTNAYLLNDEISRFMIKNNFIPIFSLDGPRIIHDRNRRLIEDKETFEQVYQNILNYTSINNSLAWVNSTYDYETDIEELMNFWCYQNNMRLLSLSPVNPYGTYYYSQFNNETIKNFLEKKKKLYNYFHNLLSKNGKLTLKEIKEINFLNIFLGRSIFSVYMKQMFSNTSRNIIKCTGSCVPGEKIFINVDGNMYPCEKVDQSMIIGDTKRGLDYSSIYRYMKEFDEKVTSSCENCSVQNVCSLCYQVLHNKKGFCKNEQYCIEMRDYYKEMLSQAVSLSEKNPGYFLEFTTKYYQELKELAVIFK